jgi:ribosomal protein S18 acetylase RimI-like enzyme
MKLTIRPSEKRDESQIIECQSQLQDAEFAVDKNRKTGIEIAKKYIKYIRKEVGNKKGGIYIAEINNEIAGLITMYIDENEIEEKEGMHLYISDLVVRKKHRGQGIGQSLMKYAERFAKENNIKEIHLTVLAKNTSALKLYLKKGYKSKMISLIKKLK